VALVSRKTVTIRLRRAAMTRGPAGGADLGAVLAEVHVAYPVQTRCLPPLNWEPVSGFEPLACRLQGVRPRPRCALPAQMTRVTEIRPKRRVQIRPRLGQYSGSGPYFGDGYGSSCSLIPGGEQDPFATSGSCRDYPVFHPIRGVELAPARGELVPGRRVEVCGARACA
jgi:hypothetical protein